MLVLQHLNKALSLLREERDFKNVKDELENIWITLFDYKNSRRHDNSNLPKKNEFLDALLEGINTIIQTTNEATKTPEKIRFIDNGICLAIESWQIASEKYKSLGLLPVEISTEPSKQLTR